MTRPDASITRIIIIGAGAVGGVIAGRLAQAGRPVLLVEKDRLHRSAIEQRGLRFRTYTSDDRLRIPSVASIDDVQFADGDAAIVAVKSYDSDDTYRHLAAAAGRSLPVFAAQNGIGNDEVAAQHFDTASGIVVLFNGTYLQPGEVEESFGGRNEVGAFPHGVTASTRALIAFCDRTELILRETDQLAVKRWNKLLLNLSNAVMALLGRPTHEIRTDPEMREFIAEVYLEGQQVLDRAGIAYAESGGEQAFEQRKRDLAAGNIPGLPENPPFVGYVSMTQDLMRGSRKTELDWITGPIVDLGQRHGVPTPLNAMLYELVADAAARGIGAGSHTIADLRAETSRRAGQAG